jgi:uncharacterized protein
MLGWLLIALAYIYVGSLPLSSPDIVTIQVIDSIVYTGKSNKVEIEVNVKEGYHIQANEVSDESLIPTTLEITSNEYLTTRKQEFPRSKKFKLEGTDRFLNVYDGKFLIKLFIDPPKTAAESKYCLEARLRYQACDSRSCLFPRTIDFSIPLQVKSKK